MKWGSSMQVLPEEHARLAGCSCGRFPDIRAALRGYTFGAGPASLHLHQAEGGAKPSSAPVK